MKVFDIQEAKAQLDRLVESAAAGEAFIIAVAGKPMVKVVSCTPIDQYTVQRLGFLRAQGRVPDDFDEMGGPEIETLFIEK